MALNINEQARKEANLRLLHRSVDRSICNILASATHVVLYQFQQASQTWEKSNVEGSLFLAVKTSGEYLLAILNRNSPDNYPIELTKEFQLQHKDPYLIFKQPSKDGSSNANGDTIIRGIWFPNPNERILMNDWLNQVLAQLQQQQPPPPPQQSTNTSTALYSNPSNSASHSVSDNTTIPTAAANTISSNVPVDHGAAMAALLSPLSLGSGGGAPLTASSSNGHFHTNSTSSTTTTNNNKPVRQSSPSSTQQQPPTLDKKSLQLALLSLIQDDRFLDLLHAQYLKVAHARANRSTANNNNNS